MADTCKYRSCELSIREVELVGFMGCLAHTEFVKYFISFVAICDAVDEQFYHELLTLALIICTGNEVPLFI